MAMVRTRLNFEAVPDNEGPDAWRVEAIDFNGEGVCFVSVFIGHGAEERAKERAAWKNSQGVTVETEWC